MSDKQHHIVKYGVYVKVLVALLVLTLVSVAVTAIQLNQLAVTVAILLASIKSALVLIYFMHLKYEKKIYALMVGLVLLIFVAVIIVTFFDYSFR